MSTLSASTLLQAWEQGQGLSQPGRALLLLAVSDPSLDRAELGLLPVGQRDQGLLALRTRLFGSEMISVVSCPHCGERLEAELNAKALLQAESSTSHLQHSIQVDGFCLQFRSPNGSDLEACASFEELENAEQLLMRRCIQEVTRDGAPIEIDEVPSGLLEQAASIMAEADPMADIQIELQCLACSRDWHSPFDITAFLWQELQDWAMRLLRDIHQLASAYAWSERDILAMSPWRRRFYLEMVRR
jgi:hypothetical protein